MEHILKGIQARVRDFLKDFDTLNDTDVLVIVERVVRAARYTLFRRYGRNGPPERVPEMDDIIREAIEDPIIDGVSAEAVQEAAVAAVQRWVLTTEQASLLDKKTKGGPDVLAAGPVFGGEGTEPYRDVILRWPDFSFSVHRQDLASGEFTDGDYISNTGPHGFWRAVKKWEKKVVDRIADQGCNLMHYVNPENF